MGDFCREVTPKTVRVKKKKGGRPTPTNYDELQDTDIQIGVLLRDRVVRPSTTRRSLAGVRLRPRGG
jgi:hypothetical protein